MRRRLSLIVLLASSSVFLGSLYLTWVESGGPAVATNKPQGPLDLFSGGITYDGWGSWGQAAALVALALAVGAGAALLRPQRETHLPFAGAGMALLYLALFSAAALHGTGVFRGAFEHRSVHLAAGAYLGLASAAVALLAAIGAHWDEPPGRPQVQAGLAFALTIGLLAAFILPWLRLHAPRVEAGAATGYEISNSGDNVVVFIALLACFGLLLWGRRTGPGRRLATALGIAVLVGGGLSPLGLDVHWHYEAWMQLGCSLGLVALALATGRGLRISSPRVSDVAAVVAASLLVASMFMPWQKVCGGGACASTSGWTQFYSATAGGLAVTLLVLLLGFRHLFVELAVGAAVYVMAAGFVVTEFPRTDLGYGATLGFAGAALLLVVAARQLGSVPAGRRRLLMRFVPMIACLGFLAIPVATLTGGLSQSLESDSLWRVYWYWLEVGAILVVLRLLGRWLGGPKADDELVLLPLALLALTVIEVSLVRRAFGIISWEGWVSIGLCVLLAVLGWLERTSRLERFRVPDEIWRVDRLPGES